MSRNTVNVSILICLFQIFELYHIFKGSGIHLYVTILSIIWVSRHQHILSFLHIYSRLTSLLAFRVFLYGIYVSSQYIKVITMD
jgi:hypothetical protein